MKWLGNFPDPFVAEIAGQPAALRRAAGALDDQAPVLDTLERADRNDVVFTGMGSSCHACYPAVNELAAAGRFALYVDAAELLHFRGPVLEASDLVVLVSQSGQSAEIVLLAESLPSGRDRLTLSITNGLDNRLARRCRLTLDTRAGMETGPSTMTFVASMAQLAAVAVTLSGEPATAAGRRVGTAAGRAAEAIESILDGAEAMASRLADAVGGADLVAVLGQGPARAAAEMGALTLKEGGVVAESFETAAFRHGPFELAGPGLAAVVVATEPETRHLDLGLAADLVDAGACVIVVASGGEVPAGALGVSLPDLDRLLRPAVSIVPLQLLSWRLALDLGRVPGDYQMASKVTTRE